jgi:hypothetical protein
MDGVDEPELIASFDDEDGSEDMAVGGGRKRANLVM